MGAVIADFQRNYNNYLGDQIQKTFGSIVGTGFKAFQHSGGFNYMTSDGLKYNHLTVECLDSLLKKDKNGELDLEEGGFSKLYYNVLGSTRYVLSEESQKKTSAAVVKYDAQAAAVIKAYQKSGLPALKQTERDAAIVEIYQNCSEKFGGEVTKDCSIIPDSYMNLKVALQTLNNMAGESMQLVMNVANRNAELAAIIANIESPSDKNGGIPVNSTAGYYAGYNKIPDPNTLVGSLGTESNAITIEVTGETYDEEKMNVHMENGSSFFIPIGGLIDIEVNHKSTMDMEKLKTEQTSFYAGITYSGLTAVPVQPTPFEPNGQAGWYDEENLLKDIKNKTGRDEDGYKLTDNRYKVDELFGGRLAHLKTMLISKTPTIVITFTKVNMEYAHKVFRMNNDVTITLFGFIKVGQHSHDYQTSSVSYDEETQSVTLTFSEPEVSGTPDDDTLTAFIMGGVPEYPAMN